MSDSPTDKPPFDLESALQFHRPSLVRFVEREARGILDKESADDLVQGIHIRALRGAENYIHTDERGFLNWIATLARRHIADRHEHWVALRRAAPGALHITQTWSSSGGGVVPAASSLSPGSKVVRKEDIERAAAALHRLEARDRALIEMMIADVDIDEIAKRLGIGYEAAKKARQRAVERLREEVDR